MGTRLETRKDNVRVNGIDIACELRGDGYPLLLIIGLGGVKEMWSSEFLDELASRFLVVSYDSRGMGETSAGEREISISQMASDAAGLLSVMGMERAHVLGYSMGGYVAQELALEMPSAVDHLVLISTECGGANGIRVEPGIMFEFHGASPSAKGETTRSFFLSADWIDKNQYKLHDLFGSTDREADRGVLEGQAKAMREWEGSCSRLPDISNPTLVVTGSNDVIILPENAKVLSELIPRSTLVSMEGGDHGFILQFPTELAEIVSSFLTT